jgi:hypothetical protein
VHFLLSVVYQQLLAVHVNGKAMLGRNPITAKRKLL